MTFTSNQRTSPSILVTGTPGTGKTTFCELVALASTMKHIPVGDVVKIKGLHEGWDDQYGCYIVNEEKLIEELEPEVIHGGCLVDYHSVDFLPEDWFDLIIVLRAQTHNVYDRLVSRNYSDFKVKENVTAEIMQVILEDVKESYPTHLVWELQSDTVQEMDTNVERVLEWIESWNPSSGA